jgi:hypothetical protein
MNGRKVDAGFFAWWLGDLNHTITAKSSTKGHKINYLTYYNTTI